MKYKIENFAVKMNKSIVKKERHLWSREETASFIDLVQQQRALWDSSCADYKNNSKRAECYEIVSKVMGISKDDVQRKLHNLRNQYNTERRKILQRNADANNSEDDDAKNQSTWVFYEQMRNITPSKSKYASGADNGNAEESSPNQKQQPIADKCNGVVVTSEKKSLKRKASISSESDDDDDDDGSGMFDLSNFNTTGFIKFKEDATKNANEAADDASTSSSSLSLSLTKSKNKQVLVETPSPVKKTKATKSGDAVQDDIFDESSKQNVSPKKSAKQTKISFIPKALNENKISTKTKTTKKEADKKAAAVVTSHAMPTNGTAKSSTATTTTAKDQTVAKAPKSVAVTQEPTAAKPEKQIAKKTIKIKKQKKSKKDQPTGASALTTAEITATTSTTDNANTVVSMLRQRANSICDATMLTPAALQTTIPFNYAAQQSNTSFCSESTQDQFEIFGRYIASEMRQVTHDGLRRQMKRQIQQIILDVQQQDEVYCQT